MTTISIGDHVVFTDVSSHGHECSVQGRLYTVTGMSADRDGNDNLNMLYVTDADEQRIHAYARRFVKVVAPGEAPMRNNRLSRCAKVVVSDRNTGFHQFTPGTIVTYGGGSNAYQFFNPANGMEQWLNPDHYYVLAEDDAEVEPAPPLAEAFAHLLDTPPDNGDEADVDDATIIAGMLNPIQRDALRRDNPALAARVLPSERYRVTVVVEFDRRDTDADEVKDYVAEALDRNPPCRTTNLTIESVGCQPV